MAELDRNTIVETTREGKVRKAREGTLQPTWAPLGYTWSELNKEGRKLSGAQFEVNPGEAEMVRLIFERFPTMTLRQLYLGLNDEGYRLPCKSPKLREKYGRRGRLFNAMVITKIISN